METVTLHVTGMTCDHCVHAVRRSLARIQGVGEVQVTLDPPRAVVSFDPARVDAGRLAAAPGREGYPSTVAPG